MSEVDLSKEPDSTVPEKAAEPSGGLADTVPARTEIKPARTDTGTVRLVAFIAATVALVFAVLASLWFGGRWVQQEFFTVTPRVDARDAALDGARQAALNMSTTNLDDVPGSSALQRSSMTGALLDSATKNQQQIEAMMRSAGVKVQAKIVGSALSELNSERDKASAVVVLRVTETRPDRPAANYRYTWSLNMAKVGDVWKAEQVASLEPPVLLGGNADSSTPAQPAVPPQPAPGQPDQSGQPGQPKPGS
ncbi:hypothetical protein [Nocardia sp. NPDC052566]|uniref:hypothetical protein n=1 Tax=Nocardia sp. NPDC052566 TaxID=3364330 RepID=UPI0037C5ED2D